MGNGNVQCTWCMKNGASHTIYQVTYETPKFNNGKQTKRYYALWYSTIAI